MFKEISDEDAEIDFQKVELLVNIEYLENVSGSIFSVFTAISKAPSTWFEVENMIEMIISELSEVSRWLDEWRVVSFFKAEKFKSVKQLSF